jgi:hypothetical protein
MNLRKSDYFQGNKSINPGLSPRSRRYSTSSSSGCGRRNSAASSESGRRSGSPHQRASIKKQHSFDNLDSVKKKTASSKSRMARSSRSASLKKSDSLEGHEEAVKSLVAAVQETRTMRKKKK